MGCGLSLASAHYVHGLQVSCGLGSHQVFGVQGCHGCVRTSLMGCKRAMAAGSHINCGLQAFSGFCARCAGVAGVLWLGFASLFWVAGVLWLVALLRWVADGYWLRRKPRMGCRNIMAGGFAFHSGGADVGWLPVRTMCRGCRCVVAWVRTCTGDCTPVLASAHNLYGLQETYGW